MSDNPTNNAPEFAASSLEAWAKAAAKSAPGGDVSALNWVTPDGITVKPLYTAEDTASLPYANTLPGFEPYLRGPQATMYAVRPWTKTLPSNCASASSAANWSPAAGSTNSRLPRNSASAAHRCAKRCCFCLLKGWSR